MGPPIADAHVIGDAVARSRWGNAEMAAVAGGAAPEDLPLASLVCT